ncbi:hypothetical protein K3495_g16345, partial [Podosphaera aphanis]
PSAEVASSLNGYLDQVRAADATLSSLDPNYIIRNASTNNTHSLPTTNQLTTSEGGDMMDLSVLWTAKDNASGRRPKDNLERDARKIFNRENDLCQWCSSSKHNSRTCPTAPWNKGMKVQEDQGKVQSLP